jgi:glycine cleavage system T protein (aminomethyltransferase)
MLRPTRMPRLSPLHPRTFEACSTFRFKDWAGYVAVCQYGQSLEREYHALRHGAGLLDVSPLCKYEVRGPDAAAMLSRVSVRDLRKLRIGRVAYLCWCDEDGYVIDDGTCSRLSEQRYRLTSAAPALHWLTRQADGFDVAIEDVSALAALALQGPMARAALARVAEAEAVAGLRYFRCIETAFGSGRGWISRTGYTGDLGYELWLEPDLALEVWDRILEAGHDLGAAPVGLDALDVVRIEAGLIMRDVDYYGAPDALADSQRVTPFEIGLGWMVDPDRDPPFVGQAALRRRGDAGRRFVGLSIDHAAVEALFARDGLPVALDSHAWRDSIPVYAHGAQVGRATSGCWSPLMKENVALATVDAEVAVPGTELFIEQSVEGVRSTVGATVRALPLLDLERRKQ